MTAIARIWASTIGLKQLVGATGFVLVAFVLGHMIGNLSVFAGPDAINTYAAKLKGMGGLLWLVRAGLLAAFLVHVAAIFKLSRRNAAARTAGYAVKKPLKSTFASRSMVVSGAVLFAFVAYHLAHFTFGYTNPSIYHLEDAQGRHDVYSMVVLGFQQPLVSSFYLFAMGLLFLHLSFGVASLFQTAGVRRLEWRKGVDLFGRSFALIVVAGNIAIVLACLLHFIEPIQGKS